MCNLKDISENSDENHENRHTAKLMKNKKIHFKIAFLLVQINHFFFIKMVLQKKKNRI